MTSPLIPCVDTADTAQATPAGPFSLWAVCLCAQWCATCREYQPAFEALALARQFTHIRFIWVDVEEHADMVGDYDVETFPTVLLANHRGVHFAGPVLPQIAVLERLLQHSSHVSDMSHIAPHTDTRIDCTCDSTAAAAYALWQRIVQADL